MPDSEGSMRPTGELDAVKNPEPYGPSRAVRFEKFEVTARFGEAGTSIRVTGHATYHGRTAAYSIDVDPKEHPSVERALQSILNHYAEEAEGRAMESAYEAVSVARRKGELG